ncbi:MAG: hypothetical protein AAGI48_12165 [Verrucomicrobiota bacterium]
MYFLYQIPSFLATAVLLVVLLRSRDRLGLPLLLTVAPMMAMLGSLWGIAQYFCGVQRIQDMLLTIFPVGNDPERRTSSQYFIDEVHVGPVYRLVMELSYFVHSLGWLLFGIGLLIYVRRRTRELHSGPSNPPVTHA